MPRRKQSHPQPVKVRGGPGGRRRRRPGGDPRRSERCSGRRGWHRGDGKSGGGAARGPAAGPWPGLREGTASRHPGGEDRYPSVRPERRRLLLRVPAAERGERPRGGRRAGPRGAALPPVRAAAGCQPGPELPAVRRRRGRPQPAHRLLLPALPLRLALLQPPQAPHEDAQRGEALRLPAVRLRLRPAGEPDAAPAHAHRGEAVPLHGLQLRLQQPGQPQTPRARPQPGQALPVCRLRLPLQPEPQPEAAHAQPPPARGRGAAPAGQGPRAPAARAEPARGQRQRPLPARLCPAAGRGGGRTARAALPLHVPHVRAGAGRRLRAGRGPGRAGVRALQPGGAGHRAGCQPPQGRRGQGLRLQPVPLRHPLPQPPGAAHEDAQRGEALRLPALPLRLRPPGQPEAAPARAHGREALQVPALRLRLRQPGQPQASRAHPLRRQALPVQPLQLQLQPEHEPEAAHAAAHGREALPVPGLLLHHRALGQLQAPPEDPRPHGRELGEPAQCQSPPGPPSRGHGPALRQHLARQGPGVPALPGGGRTGGHLQGAQGCLTAGPEAHWASAAPSCLGSVKRRPAALSPARVAARPRPQPAQLPDSACRSLPLPAFGDKGGGGNRTGSMAVAVLVGVIYIVYKSIKQSVLLSALHPEGLVLLLRTARGWHERGGTAATPQQTAWYQSGSILIIVAVCKHQLLSINALSG